MCYPAYSKACARQRGAALVLALLVFAMAAALMVGLQRDFQLQLQRASNAFAAEQAWSYLLGAEALASVALRADADSDAAASDPVDDLNELWAQPTTPYALDEGGWLSGQLEDLQGRLNVNGLVSTPPSDDPSAQRFNATQKMMIRLLQSLEGVAMSAGEAIALTEAIADFVDADIQRRSEGAEDDAYRALPLPYTAANRPLASISELRAIRGMTPAIYQALAPYVTVWPSDGSKINWRTAPDGLWRAFNADDSLDPMPVAELERLLLLRKQGVISSVDELLADSFFTERATAELRSRLTDTTEWFLLSAEVQIADRVRRLYSVLQRTGRRITCVYRSSDEP